MQSNIGIGLRAALVLAAALCLPGRALWGQTLPPTSQPDEAARFAQAVRNDVDGWLGKFTCRVPGSDEQQQALKQLVSRIEAAIAGKSNIRFYQQTFPLVMPRVLRAELRIDGQSRPHRIYPLWPATARLHTTPADGIPGKLVYVGTGDYVGMTPSLIRGQIAVMEMTGGDNWQAVYNLGATAIILLGSPDETQEDAHSHLSRLPINVPRFYVPAANRQLQDRLRRGAGSGRLLAEASWEQTQGTNYYVLIKPARRMTFAEAYKSLSDLPAYHKPADSMLKHYGSLEKAEFAYSNWAARQGRPDHELFPRIHSCIFPRATAVAVATDATGVVPELAGGADAAVDEAVGLNLLRHFAANPPVRPVLLAFLDATTVSLKGARSMLAALATVPDDRRDFRDYWDEADRKELAEYQRAADLAAEIGDDGAKLPELHRSRYADLTQFVKDEIARKVVPIDLELSALRLEVDKMEPGPKRDAETKRLRDREDERLSLYAIRDSMLRTGKFSDEQMPEAKATWGRVGSRVRGQLEEMQGRIARTKAGDELREKMLKDLGLIVEGGNSPQPETRPVEFMLGLDLSDSGVSVGRRAYCAFYGANDGASGRDFSNKWLTAVYKEEQERPEKALAAVNRSIAETAEAIGKLDSEFKTATMPDDRRADRDRLAGKLATLRQEQAGAEAKLLWAPRMMKAVSRDSIAGVQGESVESFTVGSRAALTSPADSFATAAATWGTLDGYAVRADTPQDRTDRLDWDRLTPQIEATFALVRRLLTRTDFEVRGSIYPRWTRAHGVVVDQVPGEPVPRMPMQGYLTTLINGTIRAGALAAMAWPHAEGVRFEEFCFTGINGAFVFDALPSKVNAARHVYFVQSYRIEPDGRISRAIDLNKIGRGVRLDINFNEVNAGPRRAVAFNCREFTLLELFDPRFLTHLPAGTMLDARRGSKPQRLNYALTEGQLAGLLEPDTNWQIPLRAGTTQNRSVLLNMKGARERLADPEGLIRDSLSLREAMVGFRLNQRLDSIPLHRAAMDMANLDQRRVQDYRKAGITAKPIEDIRKATDEMLRAADRAAAAGPPSSPEQAAPGLALFESASGALASEARAYQAIQDLANDVIRAAIFLLLALVPFSFALERLVFASAHIYRQLAVTAIIFAVMTAILWSFHPAFRISSQPLMIIMAFGIIFMSLLVISIVYQKFKSQLEEMRSGRAESSGARTSRVGLAVSAVKLGIANMRKRKLRTALTGATVVLITFALLCFTSVSSYVGHKELTLPVKANFAGVLIRQPQGRGMPMQALTYIRNLAGSAGEIVPQFWWVNSRTPDWRLHVRKDMIGPSAATAPDSIGRAQMSVKGALGLAPGEDRLTGVGRVLANWTRFTELSWMAEQALPDQTGLHGGCYLPQPVADELGVKAGERVVIAGRELEVVAVFDVKDFDDHVRSMIGDRMTPIDYTSLGDQQRAELNSENIDQLSADLAGGVGLAPDESLQNMSAAEVVILPASMLERMAELANCSLRSIAINTDAPLGPGSDPRLPVDPKARAKFLAKGDNGDAPETGGDKAKAAGLASRLAFPIYYSDGDQVKVVAATALTPTGPKSMFIMLIIAGMIIFNTMLNSIAERKKEIHIYTSLGLAPLHVGVLFMTEAITYGLMGSIFGYIVGQGAATVLSHLDLLSVTLNYSGTQAIATMLMVLAVVVISALVPAYMAGKLASPSEEMKWHVPRPENDVIRDTLPFTVTRQTANGVAMFIYDYLDAHREGSIGHFSTDRLRLARTPDGNGGQILGVEAAVWLAPYDLGVRQDVRLTIRPTDEDDVLEIDVELGRGSGQVASWWKLNRVFLGDLRKQLLGWRKLKTARVLEYISNGANHLAAAPVSVPVSV